MEPVALKFTNLSQDLEWKNYHELFSNFGKVGRLYIDPLGQFGKVQFRNNADALNAQKELDGKPPLKLVFGEPSTSDLSSLSSNTTSLNNSAIMYRRRYNRYDDSDDVDVRPTDQYVDVYGRILDTLESDDGHEIYVPISDLKKSGFEVFLRGTLPKPGELEAFDDQLFKQHELYLRTKSKKFMINTRQLFPPDRINGVIQKLQNEFRNNYYQGPADNEARSSTVTSPTSNPQQNRNYGRDNTFDRKSAGYERKVQSTYTNNTNSTHNRDDRTAKDGSSAASNSFQTRRSYNDANTSGGFSQGHNKSHFINKNEFSKKEESVKTSTPVREQLVRDIPQQEEDDTYLLRAHKLPLASEQRKPRTSFVKETPDDSKSSPSPSVKPPGLRRPNPDPPQKETIPEVASSTPEIVANTSNDLNVTKTERKIVIEDKTDSGYFDCTEIINEDTFVGVAMPATYVTEVCILDEITTDCKPDPTFKPNLGDTVAVLKDDAYVRGVIINNLNKQYTCALIDYGLTISVPDVRPLPEKFMNIPEFACLCKSDHDAIQGISKNTEHLMEIKTPGQIMVTIKDSGKVCQVTGSRWNPFETSTLAIKKSKLVEEPNEKIVVKKEETIYKASVKLCQLKSSDTVIVVSEVEGSLILRTKECNIALKGIEQELNNYQGKPFSRQPEVNQLVVSPFSDGALYRGVVRSINRSSAVIEYIDYGNCETISIKDLQTINEKLANLASTCVKITLKGFAKTKFSSKALQYLEKCATERKKFEVVVEDGDHVYDLLFKDEKGSLSEKLIDLDKRQSNGNSPNALPTPIKTPFVEPTPSPVKPLSEIVASTRSSSDRISLQPAVSSSSPVMIPDIPRCNLSMGENEVMCLFAGDVAEGTASFCIADPEIVGNKMLELSEKINACVEKDVTPYHPTKFEVCLAKFEDEWYRAGYIKEFDNSYGMFYLDYGNTNTVTAENLRKMPRELAKIDCLSTLCILQGIKQEDRPIKEVLMTKLVNSVKENEFYNIQVLEEKNGCYVITIPSLFTEWKKEGLLS